VNDSSAPAPREVRYEPDENPPAALSLGLGMQYALLSIGGIVLTPAIVIRSAGGGEGYLLWAVFAGLCVCGITTLVQAVRVGRIGAGYILLMGTSGAFIAVSVSALVEGGPGLLAALVIASSLFQFALASHLSLLRRIITPLVAGTVIMLIAVTIIPIAFDMMAQVPEGIPAVGVQACAAATLVATIVLALLAKGAWRLWAPVIGVGLGCIVASFYGLYDTTMIGSAPWIGLPGTDWPGIDLSFGLSFWTLLPVFVLVTVVGAIETIGDAIGIQHVSWREPRATDFRVVQGAVAADGLGNLLSGLTCTVPNTTYSSSVAITELTGVAARSVGVCIGGLFFAFAFMPKVTAVILAIPSAVVASYLLVLLAILFALGMRIVVKDGLDYRKSVVVGVAFWLGVGFQNQQIFADGLGEFAASILGNGMTAGGLAAILMVLLMQLAEPRRRTLKTTLTAKSLPGMDSFLREFAEDKRWDDEAANRLRAAGEEVILSLLPAEEESEDPPKHLFFVLSGDRNAAEMELIASSTEQNLEDRLALLGHWADEGGEAHISLKLLQHYASSVRHQQYHGTDIVTVRVDRVRSAKQRG